MPVNVSPTPKPRVSHSVGVAEENEAGRHRPIDRPAHVDAILSTSGVARRSCSIGTQNKAVSLHHWSRQLGWVAPVGRGAGASPFRGWPPGVTRLLGPPCRYEHEIISGHQSVQTSSPPCHFFPTQSPDEIVPARRVFFSTVPLDSRRFRLLIKSSMSEIYIQRTRGSKTSTNEGKWLAPRDEFVGPARAELPHEHVWPPVLAYY
jgi:hypothetical protein